MISLLLLIPAIAAYSISQLQQHGKLRWSYLKIESFWGEFGWRKKYKWDEQGTFLPAPKTWYYRFFKIKYKERFPLSATFLVAITDGYHLSQSVMFLSIAGSFSIALSLNFFLVWGGILLVHSLSYLIFQSKRNDVKNLMETVRIPMQEKIDTLTAIIQQGEQDNIRLLSELAAAKESIKELLPLAETELGNTINVFDMERYETIISRAKALLEH